MSQPYLYLSIYIDKGCSEMDIYESEKIIIVEGITDKRHIEKIIMDDVAIICTHGTLGVERFDELLEAYDLDNKEVFILVDEDEAGLSLRKQLRQELPNAVHIHISEEFREVATTPPYWLAIALMDKLINVNPIYLHVEK